jgi:SagB-type dehydrogenase family enzyme
MSELLWDFSEKAEDKGSIYQFYHINSKHSPRTQSFQAPKMDYSKERPKEDSHPVVGKVPFLEEMKDTGYTLYSSLQERRTSWSFHRATMTDDEILMFLAYSFGVSDKEQNTLTYPSGGRMYPVEIYLIPNTRIRQSSKIFDKDKVYRYNVVTRDIEILADGNIDLIDTMTSATDIGTMTFEDVQFLICLVGNNEQINEKYHSLTYRLIQMELGHIGQNIMLTAAMLKLSTVPLGGFFEDRVNRYLNIDGKTKQTLYVFAAG